jgi:hypothetical protein
MKTNDATLRSREKRPMKMKKLSYLVIFWSFGVMVFASSSCSWLFSAKKVECCEKTAACCYEQMCCLPRYVKAAGQEPKPFTPEVSVYGRAEDFEPQPGETITKPGLLSRWNPFASSDDNQPQAQQEPSPEEPTEEKGFFGRLLPF